MYKTQNDIATNYAAKLAACDAFQAALVAQHGKKLAGDYRYYPKRDNAETRAARLAFAGAMGS